MGNRLAEETPPNVVNVACPAGAHVVGGGMGQSAAADLQSAFSRSALIEFHQAQLGAIGKDYPDLVLTAVLGALVAGSARQLTTAVLVTLLVSVNGVFFLLADMLPGTVPIGIVALVIALRERRAPSFAFNMPAAAGPREE